MQIQAERRDNVMIVAPVGRVDSNTSSDLEQRLLHDIGAGERRFLLDLAGVEYISSAGLRVLLMLAKRLREASGLVGAVGADELEFRGFPTAEDGRDGPARAVPPRQRPRPPATRLRPRRANERPLHDGAATGHHRITQGVFE